MVNFFKKYPKYSKNRGFLAVYTYKKAMESFKSVFVFFPILPFSGRQNKEKMHLCAVVVQVNQIFKGFEKKPPLLFSIFRSRASTFACTSGNAVASTGNGNNNGSPRFKRNLLPQTSVGGAGYSQGFMDGFHLNFSSA